MSAAVIPLIEKPVPVATGSLFHSKSPVMGFGRLQRIFCEVNIHGFKKSVITGQSMQVTENGATFFIRNPVKHFLLIAVMKTYKGGIIVRRLIQIFGKIIKSQLIVG